MKVVPRHAENDYGRCHEDVSDASQRNLPKLLPSSRNLVLFRSGRPGRYFRVTRFHYLARNRGDEPVPLTRNCLNEAGIVRRVAECCAELGKGRIQASVKVNESIICPKLLA